jgi:peptide/nickel transport system permease protein
MLHLAARRFASMILIMLTISFVLFVIFEGDKLNVATKVLGQYTTLDQRLRWLENHGYNEPFLLRYVQWLWDFMWGDFGDSLQFNVPVSGLLWDHLINTGILAFFVFTITMSIALTLGVLSGISEGTGRDRAISVGAVICTSVPEFASATILVAIFVFWLDLLPGTSPLLDGFSARELVLPVAVLVIYNFGYYTRMTRASMAEVMTSQYVRTAVLKGLPRKRVVLRHALRNALIAPFTVMVLQLNYLLSGVIVVEVFFSYKGFGKLIYEAALFGDIYLISACTMVAVFVAVLSQFISDVGYTVLNPRIRFS